MKEHKTTFLKSFITVFLLFLLGYFRDFVFTNINYQLYEFNHEVFRSSVHPFFSFLSNYSYDQLYKSKWWLTGLFIILYIGFVWQAVWVLFKNQLFSRIALIAYLAIFSFSALFYGLGLGFNKLVLGYTLSRYLMGWLHSPIVFMVLMGAFLVYNQQKTN